MEKDRTLFKLVSEITAYRETSNGDDSEPYEMGSFSLGDIDPASVKLHRALSSDFIKKHHPVQPSLAWLSGGGRVS